MAGRWFKIAILLRRWLYLSIGPLGRLMGIPSSQVLVLCYHSVDSGGWRYSVPMDQLIKQVEWLLSAMEPIPAERLARHLAGIEPVTRPSFLITFDDGYRDLLKTKEFFRGADIRPLVFLLAKPQESNRRELGTDKPLLDTGEIRELAAAGWDIGCHSATHPDFSRLNEQELRSEVSAARRELEASLGIPVRYFAYPKGVHTPAIESEVRQAGYTLAFSMDDAAVSQAVSPYAVPRVGVDGTHTLEEFSFLNSPPARVFRRTAKALTTFIHSKLGIRIWETN